MQSDRWTSLMIGTGVLGLTLQSLRSDALPPPLYITVDSAGLCLAGAFVTVRWPSRVWLYRAGAAGVGWSAVSWLLLTLPRQQPSSGLGWAASLTLHVGLPGAMLLAQRHGRVGRPQGPGETLSLVLFPAVYLAGIGVVRGLGGPSPYVVADVSAQPAAALVALGTSQLLGYVAVAFGLNRLRRPRSPSCSRTFLLSDWLTGSTR